MFFIILFGIYVFFLLFFILLKLFLFYLVLIFVIFFFFSRFFKNFNLVVVVFFFGYIFFYNLEFFFVWEYDFKGRWISEIIFGKGEKVRCVVCWEDRVVLFIGKKVRVMVKECEGKVGKWYCFKEFEVSVLFSFLKRYVCKLNCVGIEK